MNSEIELITRAQEILKEIAQGINPFTKEKIEESNFVNNPKMIRCFMFCAEMLELAKTQKKSRKASDLPFIITAEQKDRIIIELDTIGFTQFTRLVNEIIDQSISRKASPIKIINSLKTLGIIGEVIKDNGKKETTVLPNSEDYGFISVHRNMYGKEFDQVMANRQGQKYLIDNLEMLMGERR